MTSHTGPALIGQCFEAAQLNRLDVRFPTLQGMRRSDIVKSHTGLLSLGKSDFDAMESFRREPFFKHAFGLQQVPSSVRLRQRMERLAGVPPERTCVRDALTDYSVRLLQRSEAPITAQ